MSVSESTVREPATGEPTVRPPALEMRGITKRYPGVVANDAIDLEVRPGEIHALLGENGAGKTTLMNVLYGLARPDEGQILLDGTPVEIDGPSDAIARGISMVHQHFMLVPVLSVADNILLGEETMANAVFLDRKEAHRRIVELGRRFGFEIDPEVPVGSLSVGWQQRVEILKALYRNARILVLDEPTAVLTPQETEEIFAVLRRLAAEGHSIVFISHKLYEVLEIADRITVIRRGRVVGQRLPSETDEDDLAELMVGREVQLTVDRGDSHPAGVELEVADLHARDDRGSEVVRGVSFEVRAGEILGVAGVAGNGQDELVEAIIGLRRPTSGTVRLGGRDVTGWPPRRMNETGVAYVPADRQRFGLVLGFTVADNLVLTSYYRSPFARGILRDDDAIDGAAAELIGEFDIRTPSPDVNAGTLSGGNQQKVVLARWAGQRYRVIVLEDPTIGVDIGAKADIYRMMTGNCEAGTSYVVVSSDIEELVDVCDRVLAFSRGRIVAELAGDALTTEALTHAVSGAIEAPMEPAS
ncbi:MAG TPA: ABC transporter ATP-binding protein [Candidatus Limnocylindrales bacterium]|nr:ABC transporter ATP-binding protein [Candidatus Limnocylindrales bacterium]